MDSKKPYQNTGQAAILLIITLIIVLTVAFWTAKPLAAEPLIALFSVLKIYAIMVVVCFIIGTVTNNLSQVDKLWSVAPPIYSWVIYSYSGGDSRVLLMAILVTIWGARLTFNFARRGGYHWMLWKGAEDYRWGILRQKTFLRHKLVFILFHLCFVCIYQMGLILFMTLPILMSWTSPHKSLGLIDFILFGIGLAIIMVETIADQQQYDFQSEKYRQAKAKNLVMPYIKGFIDRGLWSMVRHPNYAAEQLFWILIYLFSIVATGSLLNWSIGGCILLLLLFKGSADFSESISLSKYPQYQNYIKEVPRFIPRFWQS